MVRILSPLAILVLILSVDQNANRVKSYLELEQMMRNRGYTSILVGVPDDEEELKWWIARGYQIKGNQLVKRIK